MPSGGTIDIIIGAVLGSGSLIGLSYVVSQIAARLLAEHRPKLSSEAEIYGDVIRIPPQEYAPGSSKLGAGGGSSGFAPRRITQHDGDAI